MRFGFQIASSLAVCLLVGSGIPFGSPRLSQNSLLSQISVLGPQTAFAQDQIDRDAGRMIPVSELERSRVDTLLRDSRQLKNVIKRTANSVVHIEAMKPDDESNRAEDMFTEAGAGVVFEYNGGFYVMTNLHVIAEAKIQDISIMLKDRRFFRPRQIYSDVDTDLALMKVSFSGLEPCRIGNSDEVEMGDFVFALGSPFGLEHSATYGLLSARGRRNLELGNDGVKYQDFLQTDAAINPGNSGGPLMNLAGDVIGINTAIASNSGGNDGIGFAIPINMAMNIARQLIDYGYVTRSFLGVTLDSEFTIEKADRMGMSRFYGARVTKVTRNSPAYLAGLEPDDLILEFAGKEIQDDAQLVNVVSRTRPGTRATMVVMRNRQRVNLQATVQSMRRQ